MIKKHLQMGLVLLGQTAPFIFMEVFGAVFMVMLFLGYFFLLIYAGRLVTGGSRAAVYIIGFVFGWLAYRIFRGLYLYTIKAAHIGTMVGLLDRDPEALKQPIGYGFQKVKQNVGTFFAALGADWLIRRVSRGLQRALMRLTRWMPLGGILRSIEGFIQAFFRVTLGFIDELVWAYIIRTPNGTIWERARTGLEYMAGGWKQLAAVGSVLALIHWGIALTVGGMGVLIGSLFDLTGVIFIGLLVGFLLLIRWAVFEPFALAAMLSCYHSIIIEGRVDAESTAVLESVPAFRRLEKLATAT